jgi:catechol 2,3-dioxygenase-like lactoylglutathione lyase family enzyme
LLGLDSDAGTKSIDARSGLITALPELTMKPQKIYSALLATDLAAAESWYTKLLGRGPDFRPMESMIQWDLFAQGGLQLVTDDNLAGHGALFLIVGDIATERRRLRDLGISLGDDIQGDYSTLAQVRDPDGNLITLATPPSPYPPA